MTTPETKPPAPELPTSQEREELFSRRIEDSAVKRVQTNFAVFGTILAFLGAAGLFSFVKYLESSLSVSISSSVNSAAEKEIKRISEAMSQTVGEQLRKVDQRLASIEGNIEAAREKAQRTQLEAEVRLQNTTERVEYVGRLLVDDVEQRGRKISADVKREEEKIDEARKETQRHSDELLAKIKAELENLERLTAVVRASLRQKMALLTALKLERAAADADFQRYIAILVLKELEDADLVHREQAVSEARAVLADILTRGILRDDFFAEVRLRTVRAVGNLGFVDLAIQQALDPASWERRNIIFLLGGLGDPAGIAPLLRVLRNKGERGEIREAAIRSVSASGRPYRDPSRLRIIRTRGGLSDFSSVIAVEGDPVAGEYLRFALRGFLGLAEDPEIESMRPRVARGWLSSRHVTAEEFNQAVGAIKSVLADRSESLNVRMVATMALRRMRAANVIPEAKRVLFEEWKDFGEVIVDLLGGIDDEASVAVLREFVLTAAAERSLRLRAVKALGRSVSRSAEVALRDIADSTVEDEIRKEAREGARSVGERMR